MSESLWTQLRLGDLAEIVMGQAPPGDTVSDKGTGLPFLQGNAEFGPVHPNAQLLCNRPARRCESGDMLVSVRAPVGALNRADRRYAIGRGLAAIRFTGIDPEYGRYALNYGVSQLGKVAQGSTFEAVGRRELADIRIPTPVEEREQRRIAAILDILDGQIALTEQMIDKLTVANEAITRRLLGLNSWPTLSMRDLCSEITVGIVVRPAQYYVDSGIPVLRSLNIRKQGIDLSALRYMSLRDHQMQSKTAVQPGDIVTIRTGYPGLSAVIPSTLPTANCVDVIISRTNSMAVPEYLCFWINSEFGRGQILRRQGGLAQQHFNVQEMNDLEVRVPPFSQQRAIADALLTHGFRITLERQKVAKLKSIEQGLMDDLLTGRVRVTGAGMERVGAG